MLLVFYLSSSYDVHVMISMVVKRRILVVIVHILYLDTKLSGLELLSSEATDAPQAP
jgi:hypothetical protein